MRKRAISVVIVLCIILGLFPSVAIAAGSMLFAEPSKTNFVMDGKSVSVTQAYNVNDNNYLQLRAIAELLNGTISQFNMYWDGTYAVIETGQPFNGTVNPATLTYTENVRKSRTSFKLDGTLITFENVYMIDGDTNYLQLREFAEKLKGTASQFNVYWDDAKNEAVIVPGEAYTGKPPAGFTSIKKGQTEQEAGIGNKLFKSLSTSNGKWGFYGSYEKFLAVYYVDDKASYMYTNDFSIYKDGGKVYIDSNNNDMKYAVSVGGFPICDESVTEQLIFEFTNAFRGAYGLPALKWNDNLAAAARSHSEDMKNRKFFSHVNPDGLSPGDRIAAAGYKWRAYGENIFMTTFGIEAALAVDEWVNSSGHSKNMLTTTCDELGVGVSFTDVLTFWYPGAYCTQNFGKQ